MPLFGKNTSVEVKVTFSVTDWRIYNERQLKRTFLFTASTMDTSQTEFDADIKPLQCIRIRCDSIHKYDVTKSSKDSNPLQFVADVNPLPNLLTQDGPQTFLEE